MLASACRSNSVIPLTCVLVHVCSFYNTTVMSLSVFSQTCCRTSPTYNDFRRLRFFFTARDTVCMLKQWSHGAMVGWGNGWLNCIVIYMQKWTLSVCITAQNPLMMACIYTNTQTCTYAVHTEDLFTCTYTHICISLDKIWVRPIHCDQQVGFGGQVSIGWPKKKKKYDSSSARYTDKAGGIVKT